MPCTLLEVTGRRAPTRGRSASGCKPASNRMRRRFSSSATRPLRKLRGRPNQVESGFEPVPDEMCRGLGRGGDGRACVNNPTAFVAVLCAIIRCRSSGIHISCITTRLISFVEI